MNISSQFAGHSKADIKLIVGFISKHFPDGALTAQQLLDLARPKNSPIHKFFEWDDAVAAERHRLAQARKLITCIVVEIDNKEVRKYCRPVMVDGYKKPQYVEVNKALANPDIWNQILMRALEQAEMWQLKYNHLRELTPISEAITETSKKLRGKKK